MPRLCSYGDSNDIMSSATVTDDGWFDTVPFSSLAPYMDTPLPYRDRDCIQLPVWSCLSEFFLAYRHAIDKLSMQLCIQLFYMDTYLPSLSHFFCMCKTYLLSAMCRMAWSCTTEVFVRNKQVKKVFHFHVMWLGNRLLGLYQVGKLTTCRIAICIVVQHGFKHVENIQN